MKKCKTILWCILLMFIITACGSTTEKDAGNNSAKKLSHPSNYEQISNLIGMGKADVCTELKIDENTLTEVSRGLYMLPDKVEYCGESFEVMLNVDTFTEEKTLYGVWYRAIFENEAERAAKLTTELAKTFSDTYEEMKGYHVSNRITQQENLVELLSGTEDISVGETFDLSQEMSDNIKEYMLEYENANEKNMKYGLILKTEVIDATHVVVSLKYELSAK